MKIILLFGPTAVGKTELISQLFNKNYEIINADSMQVYRALDIGTAKPLAGLQREISHHLIDILSPKQQFHAGEFVRLADKLVLDITARGKIPVLSGGTAFYFKNYLFGLPQIPKINPEIMENLQHELLFRGIEPLFHELMQLDPGRAKNIHPNDEYRILRSLEIIKGSGLRQSSFKPANSLRSHIDPLLIGLKRDRSKLYARINQRVEEMFKADFLSEVKECFEHGMEENDPGMKGIGYKEFFLMGKRGDLTISLIKDLIKMNSRRYAKRQMTFFKALPGVKWFEPENLNSIRGLVKAFLGTDKE